VVPSFFLDGWFNPFTMAEIGGIVAIAALIAAAVSLLARRRVAERCRRCHFDLRGAQHGACPECGLSLASKRSRSAWAWAPRRTLVAVNGTIALGAWLFVLYPDPIVHALKDGAARGLTDREMVERTLGVDGNEVLGYHDARTRAISQGLRKPDGTIADFAALREAIDRASLAATEDALAGQLLAADRAGVFALQTSHLLVSDRDALARQIAVEVLEPSKLSTGVADVRRAQAMRACVQSDAEVRLSLIANESFLSRAKMIFHARRGPMGRGADPSRVYLVAGNPELAASGIDTLLSARVRTVALRLEDGSTRAVAFRADPGTASHRQFVEIERPEGVDAGTLVFTVEVEAHTPGALRTGETERPLATCVTELETPYSAK
jgi:hypothetical protein